MERFEDGGVRVLPYCLIPRKGEGGSDDNNNMRIDKVL